MKHDVSFMILKYMQMAILHVESCLPLLLWITKFQYDCLKGKVMLDWHQDLILEGVTVKKARYKEVLANLRNTICLKHPEMQVAIDWLLLYDIAPARHISWCLCSRNLLTMLGSSAHHTPNSTPGDFCLFTSREGTEDSAAGHTGWLPEILWNVQTLAEKYRS